MVRNRRKLGKKKQVRRRRVVSRDLGNVNNLVAKATRVQARAIISTSAKNKECRSVKSCSGSRFVVADQASDCELLVEELPPDLRLDHRVTQALPPRLPIGRSVFLSGPATTIAVPISPASPPPSCAFIDDIEALIAADLASCDPLCRPSPQSSSRALSRLQPTTTPSSHLSSHSTDGVFSLAHEWDENGRTPASLHDNAQDLDTACNASSSTSKPIYHTHQPTLYSRASNGSSSNDEYEVVDPQHIHDGTAQGVGSTSKTTSSPSPLSSFHPPSINPVNQSAALYQSASLSSSSAAAAVNNHGNGEATTTTRYYLVKTTTTTKRQQSFEQLLTPAATPPSAPSTYYPQQQEQHQQDSPAPTTPTHTSSTECSSGREQQDQADGYCWQGWIDQLVGEVREEMETEHSGSTAQQSTRAQKRKLSTETNSDYNADCEHDSASSSASCWSSPSPASGESSTDSLSSSPHPYHHPAKRAKKYSLATLSHEEIALRKKEQNRVAAQRYRSRKNHTFEEGKAEITQLEERNTQLVDEIAQLEREIQATKAQLVAGLKQGADD